MFTNTALAINLATTLSNLAAEVEAFEMYVARPAPEKVNVSAFAPHWADDGDYGPRGPISRRAEFEAWLKERLGAIRIEVDRAGTGAYGAGLSGDQVGEQVAALLDQYKQVAKGRFGLFKENEQRDAMRDQSQAYVAAHLRWLANYLQHSQVDLTPVSKADLAEVDAAVKAACVLEQERWGIMLNEPTRMSGEAAAKAWERMIDSIRVLLADRHAARNKSATFRHMANGLRELVETYDDQTDNWRTNPMGTHRGMTREFARELGLLQGPAVRGRAEDWKGGEWSGKVPIRTTLLECIDQMRQFA